jgi:glycosyltransferase involved in cell wall biosynthesis
VNSSVSVVICAYTERRWDDLVGAVESISNQSVPARQTIVVIDNNPQMLARARMSLPEVTTVANTGARGAGPSRNAGVCAADGEILGFLDDDAQAAPDWIARALVALDDGDVLGVGGTIDPAWERGRPIWFPPEFDWVVSCTYPGLPTAPAPIRNLIAANMFMRRAEFLEIGGFRAGFGKVGNRPEPEETDLCIRANQHFPGRTFVYDPAVRVRHRVPHERANLRYFVSRCFNEGLGKASMVRTVGPRDGLAAERIYTTRTLPRGVGRGLKEVVTGRDRGGGARSAAIVAGLGITTAGYARGTLLRRVVHVSGRETVARG